MRTVNLFFLLVVGPLLGLAMVFYGFVNDSHNLLLPVAEVNTSVLTMEEEFSALEESMTFLADRAEEQESKYQQQQTVLTGLLDQVEGNKKKSDQIYEERILAMLGPPTKEYCSKRVEIKIFKLDELGYRGYIAKLKQFNPSVVKVVLAEDKLGAKETTLDAVERTGAIFGINGGGFYTETRDGQPYGIHIGNTVINGKLVGPFNPYPAYLHFVGIKKNGKLIGGVYYEEDQFWADKPWQGVSFVPILIKGGITRPIPQDWAKTKQPRTIIGEYANGDLIMIVVDGRRNNWSAGVTLERLQEKLLELGVKDAYNLDGGGSTAMVFRGEYLNRPSDGKARPVVTNFVVMP